MALTKNQKKFIKALELQHGNVTNAAKSAKLDRTSHYGWVKSNPEYAEAVKDVTETAIDYVEDKLFQLIDDLTPSAIYFFLKCRAKHRGYVERQEIDASVDVKEHEKRMKELAERANKLNGNTTS